jgi:polysaccharide biosynthesis protein PslF
VKLCLVSAEYPPAPGGVGDYTACLATALQSQRCTVEIIASRTNAPAPSALPRHSVGGWGWGCWQAVARIVRATRPDLLHIQYQTGAYRMHPAINLLPLALRAQGLQLPVVVTCHDLRLPYLLPKAPWLRRYVTTRLLADADALVVTNQHDADRVAGQVRGDREVYASAHPRTCTVIPIGSNIPVVAQSAGQRAAWRARAGAGEREVLLGYFGLANHSKGVDLLLRALALLGDGFRLAIIGGEAGTSDAANQRTSAELRALAHALGVADRVWRSGQLPAHEVSAALQGCDIAVLPFRDGASWRRGSLLAALSHGLPLVTTQPQAALAPPLVDGSHALLLPRDEAALPHAIAAATQRLAADTALRARLAHGARQRAAAFDWATIAQQHMALYQSLQAARASK